MGQKLSQLLKSNAVLAIAFNLVFLGFTLWFTEIKHEEVDDFYLASMLSGAYGDTPNPRLHFVNFLLGFLLRPLYLIFPSISWFLIAQLFLFFVAFTGITYGLLNQWGRSFGFAVSLFFVALFSDDLYIVLQWTKSASFLSLTGFFIFLWASRNKKNGIYLCGSALLIVFGSWMRYEGFKQVLPFMILLYVADVGVNQKYAGIKSYLREEWRFMVSILFMVLVILGSQKINEQAMSGDDYRFYAQYNGIRASIMDYSRSNPVDFFDDIEEAGLNKQDYILFKNWIFYDPDVYSLKNAQIYRDAAHNNAYTTKQRLKFVLASNRPALLSGYPIFWAYLILMFAVAFTNRRAFIPTFLALVIAIGIYVYLMYVGRLVYRVEFGIWLGASCVALWFIKPPTQFRWRKIHTVLLLILLGLFKYPLYIPADTFVKRTTECTEDDRMELKSSLFFARDYDSKRYLSRPQKYHCFNGLKKELESHPENIYILSHMDMVRPQYCWFSPYEAVPVGYFKNQISLGHWTIYWPDIMRSVAEQGITNPMKELVKDNVYVVGQTAVEDGKLKFFLMRHYYDSVSVDLVKIVDGVRIYKYRAE